MTENTNNSNGKHNDTQTETSGESLTKIIRNLNSDNKEVRS